MRPVQSDPAIGLISQLVVLAALAATVGLGDSGWVVGTTCGVVTYLLLVNGIARSGKDRLGRVSQSTAVASVVPWDASQGGGAEAMRSIVDRRQRSEAPSGRRAAGNGIGRHALGPADRVTLLRATLVGAVAALVADSFTRPAPVKTLVALSAIALVLDGVDGWVARRTVSLSKLGARFDLEVDAFLLLVLSVYVAPSVGAWVLAIGAARYAFVAAGWLMPWMRGSPPPRYWCKVVAVIQGVVLAVAAADVLSSFWTAALLAASLALLAESFGREIWWLWRHRQVASGGGFAWARLVTALAGLLVFAALVAPNKSSLLTPTAFLRIPVEALVVVALLLVLPARPRRLTAALAGVVLGVVTIVKVLDMGFFMAFGRPFNAMIDWTYFDSAVIVLSDSIGRSAAIVALVAAGVLGIGVLVLVPLSVLRLTRVVERHRKASAQGVLALGVVWVLSAVVGLQIVQGAPVASTSAAGVAFDQVGQVRTNIKDRETFADEAQVDAFRDTPGEDLLTGLRGKDVVIAFVESYGRVAVEGSELSENVVPTLDAGTRRLRAAGFSSRSAFLTSPTFGGLSWLAHSTLQSGLWVDNELRYQDLVASDRFTLSAAFERAGWRTVADSPSNTRDWPEGKSFYGWDEIYDARNVGYAGPKFSYATMPDQYVLSAFQRLVLARKNRGPVMAEIDLVSSHTPWAPLPWMVSWDAVGDGSVFDRMPEEGDSPDDLLGDRDRVRAAYAKSVVYSLEALIGFVETYADEDLVLIILGDHQPATIVTGQDASHDVPVTIIAHDPAVIEQISGWGWQSGMRPAPDAPVWPMDDFRDRFLTAYAPSQ